MSIPDQNMAVIQVAAQYLTFGSMKIVVADGDAGPGGYTAVLTLSPVPTYGVTVPKNAEPKEIEEILSKAIEAFRAAIIRAVTPQRSE